MVPPFDESSAFYGTILITVVGLIFLTVFAVVSVTRFFLRSYCLCILCRTLEINDVYYLAFVPVLQSYLYGYIARIMSPKQTPKVTISMHILKPITVFIYISYLATILFGFKYINVSNTALFVVIAAVILSAIWITNSFCLYPLLKATFLKRKFITGMHLCFSILIPFYAEILLFYMVDGKKLRISVNEQYRLNWFRV